MEPESKKPTPSANPPKRENSNRKRDRKRKKRGPKAKGAPETSKKPMNSLLPSQTKVPYHSNLPPLPLRRIEEPMVECPLCGKVIENIASALTHPEGGFCHFDCVLEKIAKDERITDKQKVSYIGRGTFAVVEENEEHGFSFAKRIVWESAESLDSMKKYVEASKR
ncbi:MAG TPA: hypothetical protein VJ863_06965 [Sphaerochaeta sp.]|nr:hypothetical protein [Sphaerochaeta sp.]